MDELAAAKMWQKRKYDAGWACIRWDKEFAAGANAIQQVIWNQEGQRPKCHRVFCDRSGYGGAHADDLGQARAP